MAASIGARLQRKAARTAVSAASPDSFRRCYGPEFAATAVQEWIAAVGVSTAYIAPGSPWENGFIEGFNARLRYELIDGGIFYSLKEAQIVIESWRHHYNTVRPHGSLSYKLPAPEVFVLALVARAASQPPVTRLIGSNSAEERTIAPTSNSWMGSRPSEARRYRIWAVAWRSSGRKTRACDAASRR
jgi:hypothetical protein